MTPEELNTEREVEKELTTDEMLKMMDEERHAQSQLVYKLMLGRVTIEEMAHTNGASIATFGLVLEQLLRDRKAREQGEGK